MAAELLGADTSPALMCALARVDALIALGRTDAAAAVLADAVRRSQALKAPLVDGAALLSQASLASARGDQDAARRLLDRAVETFRQVGPASGNFARSVEMLRTRIAAR